MTLSLNMIENCGIAPSTKYAAYVQSTVRNVYSMLTILLALPCEIIHNEHVAM